jgi:Plasmid stability protein
MAQVIVRNLDENLKAAIKQRATRHGWSMEEEVRQILRRAVNEEPTPKTRLGSRIAARFADVGLDNPLPELHGQSIDPVMFDT